MRAALSIVLVAALAGSAHADGDATATPPASLTSGDAAHGKALDPIFAFFKLDRLSCKFSEEKHIALLERPVKSSGRIYFDRTRGIARQTLAPKKEQVVLTATAIRIKSDKRDETIPLDKTKDLKAFALIFPTLLRGDRAELEKTFDLGMRGNEKGWWALTFVPKSDSLKKLVKQVVVVGNKSDLFSLQIDEASGDTTQTALTDVLKNGAVSDAEIATAFGAT
jgi:hypothetical protein